MTQCAQLPDYVIHNCKDNLFGVSFSFASFEQLSSLVGKSNMTKKSLELTVVSGYSQQGIEAVSLINVRNQSPPITYVSWEANPSLIGPQIKLQPQLIPGFQPWEDPASLFPDW